MRASDLNARWFKSTRSGNNGNCVEVAFLSDARWFKSSRSGNNGTCVEVAFVGDAVATRDSKNPSGPALVVTPAAWTAFLATIER